VAVHPVTLDSYETEIEHDGRAYPVKVPDLEVLKCEACHAVVLDDTANRKVTEAFRAAVGLLTPEEIREGRQRAGLTQQQLAACLDVSPFTVSRWETGAQVQQKAMDKLLRLFFEVPEARAYMARKHSPARPVKLVDYLTLPSRAQVALGARTLRRLQPLFGPRDYPLGKLSRGLRREIKKAFSQQGLDEVARGGWAIWSINCLLGEIERIASGEDWPPADRHSIDPASAFFLNVNVPKDFPGIGGRYASAVCSLHTAAAAAVAASERTAEFWEPSGGDYRFWGELSGIQPPSPVPLTRLPEALWEGLGLLRQGAVGFTIFTPAEEEQLRTLALRELGALLALSDARFPEGGPPVDPSEQGPLGALWAEAEPRWYCDRMKSLREELIRTSAIFGTAQNRGGEGDL
jgi:putative zinc finger/helix-turn-helix YgiT family protein